MGDSRLIHVSVTGVALALFLAALPGCGTRSTIKMPGVDGAALERKGDVELDRGCLLCLRAAAEFYESALPSGGAALTSKAVGAWSLVGARERQLGIKPSDAFDRAQRLATSLPDPTRVASAYLSI
ncbi:MAG: hypothetical protein ABI672_02480, partial [Vicinamibacteria bacterium]